MPQDAMLASNAPKLKASVERTLAELTVWLPEVLVLRILDAEGHLLYTSDALAKAVSVRDRDYFPQPRSQPSARLVFSEVTIDRVTGQPSLLVAVPVQDVTGRFLGISVAAVDLLHFQRLFASLNLGPNGSIGIVRKDDASWSCGARRCREMSTR